MLRHADLHDDALSEQQAYWPLIFASSCKIQAFVQQRSFNQCHYPMDLWLHIACLHCVGFCVAFAVGRRAEGGSNWWFVDPGTRFGKASFRCTWAVLLPLLSGWTLLGMSWLVDTLNKTPDCFPADGYLTPTLCALCQVLCAAAAAIYAVVVVNVWDARRCRRANAEAIKSIETDDLVERWGTLLPAAHMELCGGLSPNEFVDLPVHEVGTVSSQCVICLMPMVEGDCARSLPGCGHDFHRACIDIWLLRQTSCPLCKTDVRCLDF